MKGIIPTPWYNFLLTHVIVTTPEFLNHYTRDVNFCGERTCSYCRDGGVIHLHHIIPRAEGGSNSTKNLYACCPECHRKIELGIYKISNPGKLNYRLWRKIRKIQRKIYLSKYYQTMVPLRVPEEIIKKHLEPNNGIKTLIKQRMIDTLKELVQERNIQCSYLKS